MGSSRSIMTANRRDWKNHPMPDARKLIALDRTYDCDEFSRISAGRVPEVMEDKWFIFFEDPWLYCHRSWTGSCIWQVQFEQIDGRFRIAQVFANRNAEEYQEEDDVTDALSLAVLLDGLA